MSWFDLNNDFYSEKGSDLFRINDGTYTINLANWLQFNEIDSYSEFDMTRLKEKSKNEKNNYELVRDNLLNSIDKEKENIFIKRTLFNLDELKQYSDTKDYSVMKQKEKFSLKRERTKLLLSKTRREEAKANENETKDSLHKNSLSSICEKSILKVKEKRKMQNREAAQKSRISKKLEMDYMKEKEMNLEQENSNLKLEIDRLMCGICITCKTSLLQPPKEEKIKFKVVQGGRMPSNKTCSILTGLFVILCLFGNFFWKSDKEIIKGRILKMRSNITDTVTSKVRYIPGVQYLKENFTHSFIDDKEKQKTFYIKFYDTIKDKKLEFSPNPEIQKNESCTNNKTFLSYSPEENGIKTEKEKEPKLKKSLPHSDKNSTLCKDCFSKNDYMTFIQQKMERTKIPDSIFFRMVVPINYDSNNEINNIISHYIDGANESFIIEKNSKKFYYEIECLILDVNRKIK